MNFKQNGDAGVRDRVFAKGDASPKSRHRMLSKCFMCKSRVTCVIASPVEAILSYMHYYFMVYEPIFASIITIAWVTRLIPDDALVRHLLAFQGLW